MSWLQVVVLAVVQGLTEFLPISSSGHLILTPHLLGWNDQGLAFDVAVHLGTLIAVVTYFRNDLSDMLISGMAVVSGKPPTPAAYLLKFVIIATVPTALVGFFLNDLIELYLRSPLVIGLTTIGFGVLLWLSDVFKREHRDTGDLTTRDALLIGLAQVLALIPGTSRSGITMTAGLALGLGRKAAARFSFLMAIPIIFLASGLQVVKLVQSPLATDWLMLGAGVVLSAIAAYLCIRWFLAWIERCGFLPFALYRILLGIVIFVLLV
ncbi:MAG: undecaprenyl-diphosphate phosphatase [Gammaproteobacteria bacterium]|nr:undecaprenyl-diphosphate phosphatase [Gammaproteobacteria bacterium]